MSKLTETEKRVAETTRDPRWQSIVTRDKDADGKFFYSVGTTAVYCRPSCAARLPRPENVRFHASTADAEKAGFRACKRCKPTGLSLTAANMAKIEKVSIATQLLKAETSALVISTASRPESREWCHEMGADLVIDHSKDIREQLSAEHIEQVDMILSTAKTADNLPWIAKLLRPFGHLSVIDMSPSPNANALMLKSASLHTEMVFSKVLHGYDIESQGRTLEAVASLVTEGRIRPIATARLNGLTPETMREAHERVESTRMIGKLVVDVH
jgi:D-arabinose 1-dehydrogenase-like Zn-dependent alcohol dehydrogenase